MLVINVKKDAISISKDENLNKGEYNVTKCKFVFSKEYDNANLVKKAVFSTLDKDYIKIITNDECDIPGEIFKHKGSIRIGVFATYTDSEGNSVIRYSPAPISKAVLDGSFIESGANSEKITTSEMEQYMQALNNGLNDVREELTTVKKIGQEAERQGDYAKEQGDYAKKQADNVLNANDKATEIIKDFEENLALSGAFNKNYRDLSNKPQINGIELVGNKQFKDLGISEISNVELDNIFKDL